MAAEAAPSHVVLPLWRADAPLVEITGDEAHYLTRVVRARPGELVRVTDGRGTLGTLELNDLGATVRARCVTVEHVARAATLELWCGAPEGERADWLIEKLAELGVARFVPVDGARARWEKFGARAERWERLAVAALRQSRGAYRLEIAAPTPLATALAGAGEARSRWLCDPDGAAAAALGPASDGPSIAVVGPSSGFDANERNALAQQGFVPVRLAATRLRTETAAVAVAGLWSAAHAGAGG